MVSAALIMAVIGFMAPTRGAALQPSASSDAASVSCYDASETRAVGVLAPTCVEAPTCHEIDMEWQNGTNGTKPIGPRRAATPTFLQKFLTCRVPRFCALVLLAVTETLPYMKADKARGAGGQDPDAYYCEHVKVKFTGHALKQNRTILDTPALRGLLDMAPLYGVKLSYGNIQVYGPGYQTQWHYDDTVEWGKTVRVLIGIGGPKGLAFRVMPRPKTPRNLSEYPGKAVVIDIGADEALVTAGDLMNGQTTPDAAFWSLDAAESHVVKHAKAPQYMLGVPVGEATDLTMVIDFQNVDGEPVDTLASRVGALLAANESQLAECAPFEGPLPTFDAIKEWCLPAAGLAADEEAREAEAALAKMPKAEREAARAKMAEAARAKKAEAERAKKAEAERAKKAEAERAKKAEAERAKKAEAERAAKEAERAAKEAEAVKKAEAKRAAKEAERAAKEAEAADPVRAGKAEAERTQKRKASRLGITEADPERRDAAIAAAEEKFWPSEDEAKRALEKAIREGGNVGKAREGLKKARTRKRQAECQARAKELRVGLATTNAELTYAQNVLACHPAFLLALPGPDRGSELRESFLRWGFTPSPTAPSPAAPASVRAPGRRGKDRAKRGVSVDREPPPTEFVRTTRGTKRPKNYAEMRRE